MEEFRRGLFRRQFWLVGAALLVCVAMLVVTQRLVVPDGRWGSFARGFQVGAAVAMIAVLGLFVVRNIRVLRDPDRLKQMYVAATDERTTLVQRSAGLLSMSLVAYVVPLGAVIAASLNATVCLTLCAVTALVGVAYKGSMVYYSRRY